MKHIIQFIMVNSEEIPKSHSLQVLTKKRDEIENSKM